MAEAIARFTSTIYTIFPGFSSDGGQSLFTAQEKSRKPEYSEDFDTKFAARPSDTRGV